MAATPAWPVLQTGSSGKNVSALQCLLTFQGYSLTIDGSFGSGTQTAVINFQRSKSLSPDGVAGPNTLSALIVTVRNGTNNYAARAAQYLLSKFESITVDGAFGSNSTSVTITFQQKMGISSDGVVGPTTWQYLFGYNAYPVTPPSGTVYASKCSGTSTLTTAQMLANAQYISTYLQGQGFSKQAACGMLGNIYHESRVNPGIWEGGYLDNPRGGYGLVQWTSTTYSSNGVPSPFLVYAASIGLISNKTAVAELDSLATNNPKRLMDAELDWLVQSMKPGQGYFFYSSSFNHSGYTTMTYDSFRLSTLDAGTLATIFHDYYERSGDSAAAIAANRATPARNYFNTGAFS